MLPSKDAFDFSTLRTLEIALNSGRVSYFNGYVEAKQEPGLTVIRVIDKMALPRSSEHPIWELHLKTPKWSKDKLLEKLKEPALFTEIVSAFNGHPEFSGYLELEFKKSSWLVNCATIHSLLELPRWKAHIGAVLFSPQKTEPFQFASLYATNKVTQEHLEYMTSVGEEFWHYDGTIRFGAPFAVANKAIIRRLYIPKCSRRFSDSKEVTGGSYTCLLNEISKYLRLPKERRFFKRAVFPKELLAFFEGLEIWT